MLFDIFMQEVMIILFSRTTVLLRYKLYAGDIVLLVNHNKIKKIIQQLRITVTEFGLVLDEAKSAIVAVKFHLNLGNMKLVDRIPILDQYCYLGELVDNRDFIDPHIHNMRMRSRYLSASMS